MWLWTRGWVFSSSSLLLPSSREHSTHVSKKHNGKCRQETSEVSIQYKAYFSFWLYQLKGSLRLHLLWKWAGPKSGFLPISYIKSCQPLVLRMPTDPICPLGPPCPHSPGRRAAWELGAEFSLQIHTYNLWGGDIFWYMEHTWSFDLSVYSREVPELVSRTWQHIHVEVGQSGLRSSFEDALQMHCQQSSIPSLFWCFVFYL